MASGLATSGEMKTIATNGAVSAGGGGASGGAMLASHAISAAPSNSIRGSNADNSIFRLRPALRLIDIDVS